MIDTSRLTVPLKQFAAAMSAEGVPLSTVQWPEMYKERAYIEGNGFGALKYPFNDPDNRAIDYTNATCETAAWLSDRTLSFYTHPVYTRLHMDHYISAFNKVAAEYARAPVAGDVRIA